MRNKIINFTPTGTQTNRENSFAPLLPNEIIEEVHQAYELGITLTHIHARDPKDLSNTYKKSVYSDIIEGIRKYCPNLTICVSLTGRHFPEFEKRSEVLELYPDMGSLTMSSLNFPKSASINEPDMILKLINKMEEYGVIPEIECFDSGMLNYTNYLINKGVLKRPHYINTIFGNIYNAQSDIVSVSSILVNKPKDSLMCVGGIGKDQLKSNIMGLLYFDGIRIGLEDNLYYKDKEKTTNIDLLKRIHRIMDEMGVEYMNPSSFKDLGYGNKKLNNIR
jgi:3-keto-5-aminohexanoate cleavage enzyme